MKTFEELGVRDDLLKAIKELGFEMPMPVQEKVIPHLLDPESADVVALAQTGTGKTAAFGLPLLQRIDPDLHQPQALIISPTRELCLQIGSDLADFSKYMPHLKVLPVYGGSSIESQIRALREGVQIIVATPGRLIDLINRGVVKLDHVHTVVLDEADEMLNMGFVDSINDILTHVPEQRKMLMFSATMPKEVARIASTFMHEPEEIVVGTRNEGAKNVRHIYYMVNARDKYLALKRIADNNPSIYAIIFCRTRRDTQEIADKLGIQYCDVYGLSEVMGPGVAMECAERGGLHVAEDHFYCEIIDPETLEPLPDGEWGELVITTLTRECTPLVRYRTRDVTRIVSEPCACGRTHRKIDRFRGRTDDMLIIRGTNVFPSQVEDVLTGIEEVTPHYHIIVRTKGGMDELVGETGLRHEAFTDSFESMDALRARIAEKLKATLLVAPTVRLVEPGGIERAVGKAKHVDDQRVK